MITDSRALKSRIQKAIASQPQKTITVLSSLLAIQEEVGYLPGEAIEEVARVLGTTMNDVWAVASFYTNFRFTPPGKKTLEVCWGPSCHVAGALDVIQEVQQVLGLTTEGETADGAFSLKYNTCLGACAQAPVIMVDHEVRGRMSPRQARELVERLKKEAGDAGV